MDRRRFGRTELDVPALTYGGGWVGGLLIRGSEEAAHQVLDKALAAGIDWIDTAAKYGDGVSETVIGKWLSGLPEARRPRVSTKVDLDVPAGEFESQIPRSAEQSLARLGLDKVPLITLHNRIVDADAPDRGPRALTPDQVLGPGGVADCLDGLRARGLCDWIGMTGLGDAGALGKVVDSGRIDVAQIYYNLLNPTAMSGAGPGWNTTDFDGLLQDCAAQDMGVMGIRIFAAGHLTGAERHGREIPITENAGDAAEEARARAAFAALGTSAESPARTALRFGLACPLLSTIVFGVGEPWHLDQALEAEAEGPLPSLAMAALEQVWAEDPAFRSPHGGAVQS